MSRHYVIQVLDAESEEFVAYETEHGPWTTHKSETAVADIEKLRRQGEARALRIVERERKTVETVIDIYEAQTPDEMAILTSLRSE